MCLENLVCEGYFIGHREEKAHPCPQGACSLIGGNDKYHNLSTEPGFVREVVGATRPAKGAREAAGLGCGDRSC